MKTYKVIKSNVHRKGLCAASNIKKGERVIEYKGKKITYKQVERMTLNHKAVRLSFFYSHRLP